MTKQQKQDLLLLAITTAVVTIIVLLSLKASSQTQILRIENFTGLGTDNHFTTVSGQPHIIDYQEQFTGSLQHVHGSTIIVHTACDLPKYPGYFDLTFRYVASHPVNVYAVSTSGARKYIGTAAPVWIMTDFFVTMPFYIKKLSRIEMETANTAECKLFEFDEFTMNYWGVVPTVQVIRTDQVKGYKPAVQ